MDEITARQQRVLDWIIEYIRSHGYAPSVREVAQGLEMSHGGAQKHIVAIVNKGYLRRDKGARALVVEEIYEAN